MKEYPLICKKAMLVLLPFASSYLCGFSAVLGGTSKTKYRSRLNFESDLRVAVSDLNPRFDKLSVISSSPKSLKTCIAYSKEIYLRILEFLLNITLLKGEYSGK